TGSPAMAQTSFKIGISGAATGPASPNYAPNIEGLRLYVRALNERGGVAGSKVELIVLDDRAAPSEAASNAKRLMDDEQVLAVDIPISRQGVDTMEQIAGKPGIAVADKQAIPPAAADVSGAAARIISREANYATSYAPVSTTVQMLGALRRQGWNGWYVHNHSSDAEDTMRQLKDPKLVMSPEYAFSVEKLPIFDAIGAAAKKYEVSLPVD